MIQRIIFLLAVSLSCPVFSQNLDVRLMEAINADRNKAMDPFFHSVTNSISPALIAVPVGFISFAYMSKDPAAKRNAINLCTALTLNGIFTMTLKRAVHRDRPFMEHSFVQKETKGGGGSFPSGHTSSAFALATSVSIAYPKWYVIVPSHLWASAVGYSRVDLGVHYPSDVLAGAIVGSGSAWLSYKLNKWITHRRDNKVKRRYAAPVEALIASNSN